ncbi:SMI1/KNR4 family protein [Sorangium sp. So ce119]|uniref:SMI1/KNR4 family protein n=1 Tax=Sorangium sp. So ce119 TaxID=3133279 RepID=UPI003F5EB974
MTVTFAKVQPPCEPSNIRALIKAVQEPLPEDYVEFLKAQDGGRVEPNEFPVDNYGAGVTEFFSASQVLREKRALMDRLPRDGWPIADAEGGNLILLRRAGATWSITFWDHELEKEVEVAPDFTRFLSLLQPLEEPKASAQVVSAWIDPSFLKSQS